MPTIRKCSSLRKRQNTVPIPPIIKEGTPFLILKLEDDRIVATEIKYVKILMEFCKRFNCTMIKAQYDNEIIVYTIEELVNIISSTSTPKDFQYFKAIQTIFEPKSKNEWKPLENIENIKKTTAQDIRDFIKSQLLNLKYNKDIIPESIIVSKFPDRKTSSIVPIVETYLNRINDNPLNTVMYEYVPTIGIKQVEIKIKKEMTEINDYFYKRTKDKSINDEWEKWTNYYSEKDRNQ